MEVRKHERGSFAWVELVSPDPPASIRFYGALLGLQAPEDGRAGGRPVFRKDGKAVAGVLATLPGGPGPGWLPFVAVEDLEKASRKAAALGGEAFAAGAGDAALLGRSVVLRDRHGARLGLLEAKEGGGAGLLCETGALAWTELLTPDLEASEGFYGKLLAWEVLNQDFGGSRYRLILNEGTPAGGMLQPRPEAHEAPRWRVYFAVTACDPSVARARELGAQVRTPPSDIAGIGRRAILEDPQGAEFALIQLAPGE